MIRLVEYKILNWLDCVRAYVDADKKEMYSMQNKNKTYSELAGIIMDHK